MKISNGHSISLQSRLWGLRSRLGHNSSKENDSPVINRDKGTTRANKTSEGLGGARFSGQKSEQDLQAVVMKSPGDFQARIDGGSIPRPVEMPTGIPPKVNLGTAMLTDLPAVTVVPADPPPPEAIASAVQQTADKAGEKPAAPEDDLMSLFTDIDTVNEALSLLSKGLPEIDVYSLAEDCEQLSMELTRCY